MRIPGNITAGLGAAALWGVLVEAVARALVQGEPFTRLTRGARLERALETGGFVAAAALAGTLLYLAIPALRRRVAREPIWVPSSLGLASSLALAVAFLWSPPGIEAIRMSQDPLVLRAPQAAVAAVVATGIAGFGLLVRMPARLPAVQSIAAAVALGAMLVPGVPQERGAHPDVFLISIDTLRADHLGCYGYDLPTSPAIDELCADSIVYESAMAAASATIPSYTSLLSGTLQNQHSVYTNYDKADDATVMLAERLRDAGYRTGAMLEGTFPGSFANVGQGFDLLVQSGITAIAPTVTPSDGVLSLVRGAIGLVTDRLQADWSVTTWASRDWLGALPAGVPVFAHFYWPYPHAPYTPPSAYLEQIPARDDLPSGMIRDVVHRYDAEIRFTDVQVGAVLDALRSTNRYEEAWIVFTSDHGEELGRELDQGDGPAPFFGHSRYLFDTSVRVPLVIKPPRSLGIEPTRVDAVVTTASVPASLLGALGLPGAERLVGPLPGLGVGAEAQGVAFSLARNPSRTFDRASVRRGPWRFIETRNEPRGEALLRYDDDRESADLSATRQEVARELRDLLHAIHPPRVEGGAGDVEKLSDRERQMLQDLGYVE